MSPSDPKPAQPGDHGPLVIPLTIGERERLNEWGKSGGLRDGRAPDLVRRDALNNRGVSCPNSHWR